jgi:hypothetical protein
MYSVAVDLARKFKTELFGLESYYENLNSSAYSTNNTGSKNSISTRYPNGIMQCCETNIFPIMIK